MGVPDFVKYIARSSPGALCRLPKGDSADPLVFDFVLVDATNAAQTLGLENLLAFLHPHHILARHAVIFALDSQRDRSGTARAQRHTVVRIGDLDVQIQKLCSQLAEVYRTHNNRHRSSTQRPVASPHILTSGRGVAGEADYKLLDLQRSLLTASLAAGATVLPNFLFVSEDSDVLCGALCGPAPQQVSIATQLQDVLYEPSILRLDRVLAFIATCTDAFYAENEREAAAVAAAKVKEAAERNAAKAKLAPPASNTGASNRNSEVHAKQGLNAGKEEEEGEEVELSVKDTAVVPRPAEVDVVRRRKQDGPMVATGVRVELTDSSDDDEPEEKTPKKTVTVADDRRNQKEDKQVRMKTVPISETSGQHAENGVTAVAAAALASDPIPTEGELTVSTITYTSSVDMVFLFVIVMGNTVNVPSLVRGATKVDTASCWQAYCKQKYKIVSASEAETGRVLLSTSVDTRSSDKGGFVLNCAFLHSILDSVHYADAEARPPGEEETNRALTYLSNAVYATLRYVVGCNLEKPPALQQTFLDSRPLSETALMLPSLSAVMWLLGQKATRTFTFPLHGLAKKELLSVASGGAMGGKDTVGGGAAALATPLHSATAASPLRGAATSAGDLHVGDHLVASVAANAWAVRGGRTSVVSLATLAQSFISSSDVTGEGRAATSAGVAVRSTQLPSMTELLKKCLQRVCPAVLAKANLLVYLVTVWEYALGTGVRRLAALTKGAAHVARAEGGDEVFTAVQAASSAGNPMRTAENAAAAVRAKHVAGHYVYSFELRRMTPVMRSSDTPAPVLVKEVTTPAAASATTTSSSTLSPANSTVGPSAAQQAVLAALGVSYDYSKAPRAPENVVNLPHSAMDDEDKAELQRLKKVAKKERALTASAAAAAKKSAKDGDTTDADASGETKEGSPKKGQRKKDKSKQKKRLGKRERLQRQKAMEKSGGGGGQSREDRS
ncbi:hypothetical protein ABB37_05075 [Leptomonas pyrrhocoris]|uniref:Uncharacterized protein n=1 Tax=Leptomonas pyrrhocoris TaxID=157538 RepID=A0A0N0DVA0_LEPPY|nr:hypothetical protein ABB37_05075 [Leptomonas pyrrhocoris]XP_015658501.1 hypothetical protein ABB37_05075 [Leptomonas pyrrhocoris]KPA80061.1 hypothetical protein ABB37_05075 [Leptomonas pyrrhocoris]KPA80062.1 hypothetical protein ABB37_05075 [Leptomonas pyrrhocoris]|eukprot:XP_015658500.1 hypothetical protein ABB37_05075 [Leptomonas pyrrhocoris]